MGMYPVSLDSPAKQDNFNRLIAQDAQRYFWTGEHEQKWRQGGRTNSSAGGTDGSREGERSRAGEGR